MTPILLRLPEVLRIRGRSRTMHYEDIKEGLFTHQVPIGSRAVGWPDHEVAALNEARISGIDDAGIRRLVLQLEAARKKAS